MDQTPSPIYNFLRKTEKYTKTDMVYATSGGFWLTFGQGVAAVSSLILAVVFANFFSKDGYGVYKYVLSVAGILGAFTLSGLNTAIIQSVARGYDGIFRKSFGMNLRWSWPAIILGIGISTYYLIQDNTLLAVCIGLTTVLLPALNGLLLFKSFLNGKKEFKKLSLYGLGYNLIPILILSAAIILTSNVIVVVTTYFISNILVAGYYRRKVLRDYRPNDLLDQSSIGFSKHLSLINVLDILATYLDKILVFQHLGSLQLATYSFAVAVPEQLRNVVNNIGVLAIPKLASHNVFEIKKVIFKKIFTLVILLIPVVLVYYFVAPFIYGLVFSQYMDAVPYSQLFALTILIEGGLAGAVFKSQMALKQTYILNITSNSVKIVLMLYCIINFGLWGIIVARLGSRLFSFLLSLVLLIHLKPPVPKQV